MFESRENLSPSCSSPDELVAYLYDEMDTAEKSAVEAHLTACDSCMAEFAALSFARLDVYEWNRDEFAPMETPRVVIPYVESSASAYTHRLGSFLSWKFPLTAAVSAVFVVVLAVVGSVFNSDPATGVAELNVGVPSPSMNESVETPTGPVSDEGSVAKVVAPLKPSGVMSEKQMLRPGTVVGTSAAGASRLSKRETTYAATRTPARPPTFKDPVPKAPRLNEFEDEEDNTLRLGDLLADAETRD